MKKQIVSDSMNKHIGHYLKICILSSIVLTIQKVPRGRCGKNIKNIVKTIVMRSKRTFYDQQ